MFTEKLAKGSKVDNFKNFLLFSVSCLLSFIPKNIFTETI